MSASVIRGLCVCTFNGNCGAEIRKTHCKYYSGDISILIFYFDVWKCKTYTELAETTAFCCQ